MPDLRTLSILERQALAAEVERRARAGEVPGAIRAALGISPMSYVRWAKLFGFRQCDLHPGVPLGRTPPKHPPGPGAYAYSGRRFRGIPPDPDDGRFVYGPDHPAWRGGSAAWRQRDLDKRAGRRAEAEAEVDAAGSATGVHDLVMAALEAGETARADQLLAAWRKQTQRAAALPKLRWQAAREGDLYDDPWDRMSDEEKVEHVSRQLGARVSMRRDDGTLVEYHGPLTPLEPEEEADPRALYPF